MNHMGEKINYYFCILSRLGEKWPVTEKAELCTLNTNAPINSTHEPSLFDIFYKKIILCVL